MPMGIGSKFPEKKSEKKDRGQRLFAPYQRQFFPAGGL